MKGNWELEQIEGLIRVGQTGPARHLLREIRLKGVPRELRLPLARLARRANLPFLALKLLTRVVRPERGAPGNPATPAERVEYAASLIAIGAGPEASELLEQVDPGVEPKALLTRAFAGIVRWDYEAAVPLLRAFTALPLADYDRLIGQVNLAAALVAINSIADAHLALREAMRTAQTLDARRLLGNCHEIAAQLELSQENYAECARELSAAEEILGHASVDSFLARKSRLFHKIDSDGPAPAVLAEFDRLKEDARQAHLWEIVRDCDLRVALRTQDNRLLSRVFHGTPFESFRARIRAQAGAAWQPDSTCLLELVGPSERVFDLEAGREEGSLRRLRQGFLPLKLLRLLAADFYYPTRSAALFGALFPKEYFDPGSSPKRVRQAIVRLREQLKVSGIPVLVANRNAAYSLSASSPYALRTSLEAKADERLDSQVQVLLRSSLGERHFSLSEAMKVLGVSKSTATRALNHALEEGALTRQGNGPATRYLAA